MSGIRTPGVERIQQPAVLPAEDELDRSLRPKKLEDFVGQERVKEQLAIFIEAAQARGEALDHVLLAGPPGLGKTSLAQIVAAELEVDFVQTAGPALERKADLGTWMLRSEDGGATWLGRYSVPVNSPHGPIQLADGRLLYAGVAGSLPPGKALCLSLEIVERGGQCGEAKAEMRGVDRVVGRGRRRERKRDGCAGKQDARRGVCGDSAAFLLAREAPRRIEERQGRRARAAPSTAFGGPPPP